MRAGHPFLTMSRYVLFVLALLLTNAAFSKGRAWSYTMNGYAYDRTTNDVLRNTSLMIGTQLVTTDEQGWYLVIIHGVTCDRGSRKEIERCNDEAYGQLTIRRLFGGASVTIHTGWRDHACIDRLIVTPPCYISRRDLYVP